MTVTIELIREKILEKAMRGELVEQNPNDEPVDVLLRQIEDRKNKLIKEKKIRKQKTLPPIRESDIPYELPEGWKWVRLGEVGEIIGGGTPKTSNPNFWSDNGISWLTPADLSNHKGKYISKGKRDISKEGLEGSSARLLPKGSVLFSSRAPIGYVAIAKNELATNQGFKSVVPYIIECNQYLYYYLKFVGSKINDRATGTTFKEVSGKELSLELLALPPIQEQKRIVKKIESIFILCDKWDQEVKKQQKYLSILREKVLDDAIKGLIVEQDENDEPAETLLNKIEEIKQNLIKEKKLKKQKSHPIEKEEIPYEPLPLGWEWARIKDIALINPRNKLNDELEVGFIPMKLIQEGYSIEHDVEVRKWGEVKKGFTHFQENDVIVSKITPCFENRKSSIVKNLPNNYGAGTTELHVVRPFHKYIMKEYLMIHFKSKRFIETGIENFSGTAGQQRINKDFISNYVIGIPPLNEQRRIVEKVKKLFAYIDELESQIILPK